MRNDNAVPLASASSDGVSGGISLDGHKVGGWRAERCRVLVMVEPPLLRACIEDALMEEPDVLILGRETSDAIAGAARRRALMHPSGRPDVVIASPGEVSALCGLGLDVIEVSGDATQPLLVYRGDTVRTRREGSMRALLDLVREVGGSSASPLRRRA